MVINTFDTSQILENIPSLVGTLFLVRPPWSRARLIKSPVSRLSEEHALLLSLTDMK